MAAWMTAAFPPHQAEHHNDRGEVGEKLGRHIMLSSGVVGQVIVGDAGDPAARLIVDAPVTYGVSGGGVYDARTGGLLGLVEDRQSARLHGDEPLLRHGLGIGVARYRPGLPDRVGDPRGRGPWLPR